MSQEYFVHESSYIDDNVKISSNMQNGILPYPKAIA